MKKYFFKFSNNYASLGVTEPCVLHFEIEMTYLPLYTEDHNSFLATLAEHLGQPIPTSLFSPIEQNSLSSTMPDLDNKSEWQTFVMAKNYELANDVDPDIRAKALERLAKSSIVGLYETKVQVNVSLLPPDELKLKLESLVNRINERVVG